MDRLTKLYVEITTACNLGCQMCVQRVWDEPLGHMPLEDFTGLVDGLHALDQPAPVIHLGGYGEPLSHPDVLEMVRFAKTAGVPVEMTTNGVQLDEDTAAALVDLGLDRLVVSLDGAGPGCYDDIRVRGDFNQVVENVRRLYRFRIQKHSRFGLPRVDIAFVAMKRNIADLPRLPALATRIGATNILVSNLIPHTRAMAGEILYADALNACTYQESSYIPSVSLPKLDIYTGSPVVEPLLQTFQTTSSITWLDAPFSRRNDYCRFAREGYAAVRRDGQVSPCLSLLHDHPEYLRGRRRDIAHHTLGDITTQSIKAVWESPAFVEYRARLREFPFSPCTTCGGCERFPHNLEDCRSSVAAFPACGGCLWAQGFVQCP